MLRYWQLVSSPVETLNRVARFLGLAEDQISTVPPDNSRPFVRPGLKTSVLGRVIRTGAAATLGLRAQASAASSRIPWRLAGYQSWLTIWSKV